MGTQAHNFYVEKQFRGKDRWTADLSTALRSGRDDKGEDRYRTEMRSGDGQTADLSTTLRSGRDDKFVVRFAGEHWREGGQGLKAHRFFKPYGTTKSRALIQNMSFSAACLGGPQIPPLRSG